MSWRLLLVRGGGRRHLLLQLRDPPVEDVHLAVVAEHHVRGLEVAVEDAPRVGEVHRQAHRRERREQLAQAELARDLRVAVAQAADHLLERHALQALHREVRAAVLVEPEVVHRDDRGVLELALDAALAEEARAERGVVPVVGQEHLLRDVAADARVLAEEDLAHRPEPELLALLVAGDVALQGAGGVDLRRGTAGPLAQARPGFVARHGRVRIILAVLFRAGHGSGSPRGARSVKGASPTPGKPVE